MKILYLDLDGTIREPKSGEKFINDPLDQMPIEGALKACNYYKEQGWILMGITNQGGVKWGYKNLDSMILEQQETLRIFPCISKIYACPDDGFTLISIYRNYHSLINCEDLGITEDGFFRKPNPGMIKYSIKCDNPLFNMPLDPHNDCLFVGDREEDRLCAINAGVPFAWAKEWINTGANNNE